MIWHRLNDVLCPVCEERFKTPTLRRMHFWRGCYTRARRRLGEDPFR